MSDASEQVDLPAQAIIKPIELWTGKQLFSVLLCPRRDSPRRVNLEVQNKTHSATATTQYEYEYEYESLLLLLLLLPQVKNKKYNARKLKPEPFHMCPDDGWVCFRNGELMSGVVDKSVSVT